MKSKEQNPILNKNLVVEAFLQHLLSMDSFHATSFLKKRGIIHRKPPLDLKDRCLLQPYESY